MIAMAEEKDQPCKRECAWRWELDLGNSAMLAVCAVNVGWDLTNLVPPGFQLIGVSYNPYSNVTSCLVRDSFYDWQQRAPAGNPGVIKRAESAGFRLAVMQQCDSSSCSPGLGPEELGSASLFYYGVLEFQHLSNMFSRPEKDHICHIINHYFSGENAELFNKISIYLKT